MFLNKDQFINVVRDTTLISIDLCIKNKSSVLLGRRKNAPAKGSFFVPGGRIRKNEKINEALERILLDETGLKRNNSISNTFRFLDIYEHFYEDNFLSNKNFSTHYIVIAYIVDYKNLIGFDSLLPYDQHENYIWYNYKNLDETINVHQYTLNYFYHKMFLD